MNLRDEYILGIQGCVAELEKRGYTVERVEFPEERGFEIVASKDGEDNRIRFDTVLPTREDLSRALYSPGFSPNMVAINYRASTDPKGITRVRIERYYYECKGEIEECLGSEPGMVVVKITWLL